MANATMSLATGVYRHFKGGIYEVVGVAKHVDSPEEFVVYRPLYGDRELFVRPVADFTAPVASQGNEISRFTYLGASTLIEGAPVTG